MRTTLDLPDELFRRLKAKASLRGESLKDVLTRYVESCLKQPDAPTHDTGKRSPLPLIPRRKKEVIRNLTPELQAKLEEGDHLGKRRIL